MYYKCLLARDNGISDHVFESRFRFDFHKQPEKHGTQEYNAIQYQSVVIVYMYLFIFRTLGLILQWDLSNYVFRDLVLGMFCVNVWLGNF